MSSRVWSVVLVCFTISWGVSQVTDSMEKSAELEQKRQTLALIAEAEKSDDATLKDKALQLKAGMVAQELSRQAESAKSEKSRAESLAKAERDRKEMVALMGSEKNLGMLVHGLVMLTLAAAVWLVWRLGRSVA